MVIPTEISTGREDPEGRPLDDLGVGFEATVRGSKLSLRFVATVLCALGGVLSGQLPAQAHDELAALCPFLLHERQTELDDLELAIRLDETRLELAEEIFVLLDGLWQNDAVERLIYLERKHHRDVAKVSLERSRRRLERQQAIVEQYRLVCSAFFAEERAPGKRHALEQPYQRYLDADCEVRALDVAVVDVNLGHHQENLKSALELRASNIASRQNVILAEREVELMLEQLEQARQRAARCQQ